MEEDEDMEIEDEQDDGKLNLYDVCVQLGEGMLSYADHERITRGFRALLHER
jgi:hypothetical protein